MAPNLSKMVELVKDLSVGQPINYKNLNATISAWNDEAVFLKVDEIKVDPDEFEGTKEAKRVRDRREEELKREIHQLKNEIDKLLFDRSYYEYRQERERQWRRERDRRMDDISLGLNMMMSPTFTGIYGGTEFKMAEALPKKEMWIDPLLYKDPSQKRR